MLQPCLAQVGVGDGPRSAQWRPELSGDCPRDFQCDLLPNDSCGTGGNSDRDHVIPRSKQWDSRTSPWTAQWSLSSLLSQTHTHIYSRTCTQVTYLCAHSHTHTPLLLSQLHMPLPSPTCPCLRLLLCHHLSHVRSPQPCITLPSKPALLTEAGMWSPGEGAAPSSFPGFPDLPHSAPGYAPPIPGFHAHSGVSCLQVLQPRTPTVSCPMRSRVPAL